MNKLLDIILGKFDGMKQKVLLNKIKNKLNNTQSKGEERLIFLAKELIKEAISQGCYEFNGECQCVSIWEFKNGIQIELSEKRIIENK